MLTWWEAGDPSGPAVVYFHGTDGAKQDLPFPDLAEASGVRVLMADRPGYGTSPPRPGSSLLDVAGIVLGELTDRGVDRFGVIGWSGGGPHALACAAAAPERVARVGLLASWAPMDPPDRALPPGVRFAMRVARTMPRPAVNLMLRVGGKRNAGMVDDVRRVARPWGFTVAAVAARVPVYAWHAERDPQVPVGPWRGVAGVELTVLAGAHHEIPRDVWELAMRTVAP